MLRACWPPSPALLLADLTPASGCQDHTTSHVRFRHRRLQHHPRPPHPAPRFVTLRNAPLSGRDQIRILRGRIAVKRYLRKAENNLRNSEPVIPGLEPAGRPAARWRESPESVTTTGGYGFRACAKRASRNDGCWDNLGRGEDDGFRAQPILRSPDLHFVVSRRGSRPSSATQAATSSGNGLDPSRRRMGQGWAASQAWCLARLRPSRLPSS